MSSLYIVMPAYNEQDNIESTIRSWYDVILSINDARSRLVVFNDGSKDQTFKIASSLKKDLPLLEVIDKPNSGHGPTVIYAYNYAINNGADYIFMTDSDGQTNPLEFKKFWDQRNDYDGIFGVRKVRGDGKIRLFVENVVCFLLRIYFGVKIKDANAPFRLLKAEVLKKYIQRIPNDYNLPNIMLTAYMSFYKENINFNEISFKPRVAGTNSVNLKRIFKIGYKALWDFHKFKIDMKKNK